jgi:HSP20 family protein
MYESMLGVPGGLFGEFDRLRRELDDFFTGGAPASIRSVASGGYPAINVGNTPGSVEIYAFAPGLDASKVDITLDRGVLTIAGERPLDLPQAGADGRKVNVYSRERTGGRFTRVISLPDDIDPGRVDASYRDGVLRISVARQEAAQPRRIEVQ